MAAPEPHIALALSGGGFRATLFHLGVIRYLRAAGLLQDVDHIASVSGGSILAAHLATNWKLYIGTPEQFDDASGRLLGLTSRDVRGRIVRRLPWLMLLRLLPLPSSLPIPRTTTDLLVREFRRFFDDTNLADLQSIAPLAPRFSFVSTNLTNPGIARFENDRVVIYPISDDPPIVFEDTGAPLHVAVACSAAYPAFFTPLKVTSADLATEGYGPQYHADGGVMDNQGLQVLLGDTETADQVLISDASGSTIDPEPETKFGLLTSGMRAMELMMAQIRRSHYARFSGVNGRSVSLISIDAEPESPERKRRGTVIHQLPNIRTDLDAFDAVEQRELVHHGFHTAYEVLERPYDPAFAPPEPGETRPSKVASHLRSRFNFRLHFFSFRDYVGLVNGLLMLLVLVLVGSRLPTIRAMFLDAKTLLSAREIRTRAALPIPTEPPVRVRPVESVGDRPKNPGFLVTAEDRVWDLRALTLSEDGKTVTGNGYMTRYTEVRRKPEATRYEYWFETSGELRVWLRSRDPRLRMTVLGPRPGAPPTTVNGSATLHAYKGVIDCSAIPPGEDFLIIIYAEYSNAFTTRADWWIGMSITDGMRRASMRAIFPKALPFRNPTFQRYPNNSRLESETFDGVSLVVPGKEHELLWTIDKPVKGNTYRVNWDWYPPTSAR